MQPQKQGKDGKDAKVEAIKPKNFDFLNAEEPSV